MYVCIYIYIYIYVYVYTHTYKHNRSLAPVIRHPPGEVRIEFYIKGIHTTSIIAYN